MEPDEDSIAGASISLNKEFINKETSCNSASVASFSRMAVDTGRFEMPTRGCWP
jgi:hypothetical protein